MMKWIIIVVILSNATLVSTTIAQSGRPPAECSVPRTYQIERIDSEFEVSVNQVRAAIGQAAEMWREQTGVVWFEEATQGAIKISLEFTETQATYSALLALSEAGGLVSREIDAFNLDMRQQRDAISEFNSEMLEFESSLDAYNLRVSKWNERPGKQTKLIRLKEDELHLKRWRKALDDRSAGLQRRSAMLEERRKEVVKGQDRYDKDRALFDFVTGGELDFRRAGVYERQGVRESIRIFMLADLDELRTVVAHEFGHALGLGHISDSRAIMSSGLNENNRRRARLALSDLHELTRVCGRGQNWKGQQF